MMYGRKGIKKCPTKERFEKSIFYLILLPGKGYNVQFHRTVSVDFRRFQEVVQRGFFHAVNVDDVTGVASVNLEPFGKNFDLRRHFNKARKEWKFVEREFLTFENLVQDKPRNWKNPRHAFNMKKMDYFLFPRTQKLCRGEKVTPVITK